MKIFILLALFCSFGLLASGGGGGAGGGSSYSDIGSDVLDKTLNETTSMDSLKILKDMTSVQKVDLKKIITDGGNIQNVKWFKGLKSGEQAKLLKTLKSALKNPESKAKLLKMLKM